MNPDQTALRLFDAWSFRPDEELPRGNCSRVYANAGQVLKVPFQGEEMQSGWRGALMLSGTMGPVVERHDPESGALLMERIVPGTKLDEAGLDDAVCRRIVLEFAAQLAKLPVDGAMPVSDFVDARDPLAKHLLDTSPEPAFLHGDLHHENILLGPDGWKVIDPKGLFGDPAFEPSAFVRNPVSSIGNVEDLVGFLKGRIEDIVGETGFDPRRIWGWSLLALGSGNDEPPWNRVEQALRELESEFGIG